MNAFDSIACIPIRTFTWLCVLLRRHACTSARARVHPRSGYGLILSPSSRSVVNDAEGTLATCQGCRPQRGAKGWLVRQRCSSVLPISRFDVRGGATRFGYYGSHWAIFTFVPLHIYIHIPLLFFFVPFRRNRQLAFHTFDTTLRISEKHLKDTRDYFYNLENTWKT